MSALDPSSLRRSGYAEASTAFRMTLDRGDGKMSGIFGIGNGLPTWIGAQLAAEAVPKPVPVAPPASPGPRVPPLRLVPPPPEPVVPPTIPLSWWLRWGGVAATALFAQGDSTPPGERWVALRPAIDATVVVGAMLAATGRASGIAMMNGQEVAGHLRPIGTPISPVPTLAPLETLADEVLETIANDMTVAPATRAAARRLLDDRRLQAECERLEAERRKRNGQPPVAGDGTITSPPRSTVPGTIQSRPGADPTVPGTIRWIGTTRPRMTPATIVQSSEGNPSASIPAAPATSPAEGGTAELGEETITTAEGLKVALRQRGMTSKALAAALGISPPAVSNWVSYNRHIPPKWLGPINELLGNRPVSLATPSLSMRYDHAFIIRLLPDNLRDNVTHVQSIKGTNKVIVVTNDGAAYEVTIQATVREMK